MCLLYSLHKRKLAQRGSSLRNREQLILTFMQSCTSYVELKCRLFVQVYVHSWWFSPVLHLSAGTYILVITSSKEVGKYHGFPVFRVESIKYLACNQALMKLGAQEVRSCFLFPLKLCFLASIICILINGNIQIYVCAEKRWSILQEFVESCGIYSRIILFLWNWYYCEVCCSLVPP